MFPRDERWRVPDLVGDGPWSAPTEQGPPFCLWPYAGRAPQTVREREGGRGGERGKEGGGRGREEGGKREGGGREEGRREEGGREEGGRRGRGGKEGEGGREGGELSNMDVG